MADLTVRGSGVGPLFSRVSSRTTSRIGAVTLLVGSAMLGASPAIAAAPANDDIANAMVISEVPFSTSVDTSEAGTNDAVGCGLSNNVWFSFTPTRDAVYEVTTLGSDYNMIFLGISQDFSGQVIPYACNSVRLESRQARSRASSPARPTTSKRAT